MAYYNKSNVPSVERYKSKNYDRIDIYIPRGRKKQIESWLESNNKSLNSLLNEYLANLLENGNTENE